MGWTDERVELLRKLWLEGHSASQIAKQLAGGVTRNAVIGKVHRLGLGGRTTPASRAQARPLPRPVAKPIVRPQIVRPVVQRAAPTANQPRTDMMEYDAAPAPVVAMVDPVRREDGRLHDVLSINDKMCKFPIGDPGDADFGFCGRSVDSARYCPAHCAVAFQPAAAKKKRVPGTADPVRLELQRMLRRAG
jgi:GcrA cell cycle regulator